MSNEQIVLEHVQENHEYLLTFDFRDLDSKTSVTSATRLSELDPEQMSAFFAKANEEGFERLAWHLQR